jgi:hypothetical protein
MFGAKYCIYNRQYVRCTYKMAILCFDYDVRNNSRKTLSVRNMHSERGSPYLCCIVFVNSQKTPKCCLSQIWIQIVLSDRIYPFFEEMTS